MAVDQDHYYRVLGVPPAASTEEIQHAYRMLARRHHPDVNREPGAEERFKEITEAYHILADPESRRRYDLFGSHWRQAPEGYRPDGFGRGPAPGADREVPLVVAVEEVYRGGRRRVFLPGPGRPRQYDIEVPAGVVEGDRIRLAGHGGSGVRGGPAGDLYLVVRVGPHPRYRVSGRDLIVDLLVSAWDAALGATLPIRTPNGVLRVDVPAGSSSGRRLRLRGQGLPNPRGAAGNLYAEVRIMVPSALSGRERTLFEELARASSFNPSGDPTREGIA